MFLLRMWNFFYPQNKESNNIVLIMDVKMSTKIQVEKINEKESEGKTWNKGRLK